MEGIDFRRRAAENLLGGFFSLDDQDNVLFGPGPETFPQNLYQLDFDSQDRSAFTDINVHRDDALPNEGTTAGGDSGGPLILDAANNTLSNEDLVIGVFGRFALLWRPAVQLDRHHQLLSAAVALLAVYRCNQPVSLCRCSGWQRQLGRCEPLGHAA